jgi:hypothetical protein
MLKYHSTPKPVRIRIESGGEEHFSLDSLLKCFNPMDLLAKKNELLRWLEFQGEEGKLISDELLRIDDLNQDVFRVYKAFFHKYIEDHHIKKIEELYSHWTKDRDYDTNYSYLLDYLSDDGIFLHSGGGDHLFLYSLLNHFDPKDILEKKDELLRWLEFQGEEGKLISDELIRIDDFKKDVFRVYKAFFHKDFEDCTIESIEDLYALWATKAKGKNFNYLKAYCYNDEFLIERLYLDKRTKILEENWFGAISKFVENNYFVKILDSDLAFRKEIGNPNLLYYLGVFYKEKGKLDFAKLCLQSAKEKGTKKNAQKELKKIEDLLKRDRFYGVDKKRVEDIINRLFTYWTFNWGKPENAIRALEGDDDKPSLSGKERQIIELAFNYRNALRYSYNDAYTHPSKRYKEIIKITKLNEDDFLKKEKDFIRLIFGCEEGGSIETDSMKGMKDLAKTYIPAKYMTNNLFRNKILDKAKNFRIRKAFKKVEFVLCHIFDFENDTNDN